MKRLLILFAVLFISVAATHTFAQKKTKRKEVIIVEFLIPDRNYLNKFEIPINKNSKEAITSGEGSVAECGIPEKCRDFVASSYMLSAKAFKTGKNNTAVNFKIEVNDECKTQKAFTVYRNRQTKLHLRCKVSLTAYYGFESAEGS